MNAKECNELFDRFEDEMVAWSKAVAELYNEKKGTPQEKLVYAAAARTWPKLPKFD